MKLFIYNQENDLYFDELSSQGYYYEKTFQINPTNGRHYLPALTQIQAFDARNDLYPRLVNPASVVTDKIKTNVSFFLTQIDLFETKLNKYTEEEARNQYENQNTDNVETIRSYDEIFKSYALPREKTLQERNRNRHNLEDILINLNKEYIKKISKVDIRDFIEKEFQKLDYLKLPKIQIERLISIWIKSHNVTQDFMLNNLFGDELKYFSLSGEKT